ALPRCQQDFPGRSQGSASNTTRGRTDHARVGGVDRFRGALTRDVAAAPIPLLRDHERVALSALWPRVIALKAMVSRQQMTIVANTPVQAKRSAIQPTPD